MPLLQLLCERLWVTGSVARLVTAAAPVSVLAVEADLQRLAVGQLLERRHL